MDSPARGHAHGRRFAVTLLLLAALSACGAEDPAPQPPVALALTVSATDIGWAQLTIAMDERAVPVLELVQEKGTSPRLVAFARGMMATHQSEVQGIGAELARLGVTGENPHTRHDMPGMVTAATMNELTAAAGPAFDRLATEAIRGHLTQCRTLVAGELTSGTDPLMRSLAEGIEATRRTQLADLAQLAGP